MKELYKNIKSIGLAIVGFDDMCHLANIIEEIKDNIDYVVVGLQRISYNGEKLDPSDENEVLRLKDGGLIDKVLYIDLDMRKEPREQETDKRNRLIDDIAEHGCSHALVIDSDEFYTDKDFKKALRFLDDTNSEISYCRYVNYYHDYMHYLVYPFKEGNYVPFVTSVKYRFAYNCSDFPKPSDPTRRYERPRFLGEDGKEYYSVGYTELDWKTIKMHHLSWLRSNIRKKLYNWSAKKCFENHVELIDKAVEAYEQFDGTTEGFKANLLFNTPGNQVDVETWPKQFINPKYDFRNKVERVPEEKNILILVMSMDHPQYEAQEQAIRETWMQYAEENFKNIKVLFYKGTEKESYREGDTLYIKNSDLLEHTYSKTMDALDFIDKNLILKDNTIFEYDYILRTNTSTYINIDLLNEYVKGLDKYEFMIHCAEIDCCWWSKMHFYAKGNALLMNKFYVERVKYLRNNQMEKSFGATDDCIIGATINSYNGSLGIDHKKHIKSFGMFYELDKELNGTFEDYKNQIIISVKTVLDSNEPINDERSYDEKKMRNLHANIMIMKEEGKKFEVPTEFNKKVMWIEDKAEWLKRDRTKCNTRYIVENHQIPYQDAIEQMKLKYNL